MTSVIWAIVLFPLNHTYFDAHKFPSAYMRYSSCKDVDVLSIWATELSPLNHTYFMHTIFLQLTSHAPYVKLLMCCQLWL
jgi:hypothetical protein